MLAAENGDLDIVKLFEAIAVNRQSYTALHWAVLHNKSEVTKARDDIDPNLS